MNSFIVAPLLRIGPGLQGKDEFLGRTICKPMVKLSMSDERTCVLQWHELINRRGNAGEMLASFELLLVGAHATTSSIGPSSLHE